MGPVYGRPQADIRTPAQYRESEPTASSAVPDSDRWWESFQDFGINRLVTDVARNNLDIRRTTAAVIEFQARQDQAWSRRFPRLDARADAARSQSTITEVTGISASPVGGIAFARDQRLLTADTYLFSIPASYELDLWGRLARSDEAARYDLVQAEESRRTVIQSLIAESVSLYLEMESLERRIVVNRSRIENFEQTLTLVEKRYAAGLSGALEVRQTRRSLSQARSVLPTLVQALGAVQHRLSVLAGRYPETEPLRIQPEDYYRRLSPVPVGLPSELLLRRPDIRSAEAGLAAASARIGEAKAARFPSITLTGTLGFTSAELDQLFLPESGLWKLAAGITAPIFDAGGRRAIQKATEARYEQQMSAYAKTVLTAFAEVEGTLLARKQQLIRREQLIEYLQEARAAQEMALNRYEKGLVEYLSVLDAIIARFRAEEDLILSDLALMQNRVSLYRALGGGWQSVESAVPVHSKPVGQSGKPEKRASRS